MKVKLKKSQGRFKRIRDPKGPDHAIGYFTLHIDIAAKEKDLYIPVSIASGKKPAGFVYQIEGSAIGKIVTTSIASRGTNVTQITSGTIIYSKIPAGQTATFNIQIEIKGSVGKIYQIIINTINYKFDPSDARYQKYETPIKTRPLRFA